MPHHGPRDPLDGCSPVPFLPGPPQGPPRGRELQLHKTLVDGLWQGLEWGEGGGRKASGSPMSGRIQSLDEPADAWQEMALGHPKHRKIKEPVGIKQRNNDKYVPTALSPFWQVRCGATHVVLFKRNKHLKKCLGHKETEQREDQGRKGRTPSSPAPAAGAFSLTAPGMGRSVLTPFVKKMQFSLLLQFMIPKGFTEEHS